MCLIGGPSRSWFSFWCPLNQAEKGTLKKDTDMVREQLVGRIECLLQALTVPEGEIEEAISACKARCSVFVHISLGDFLPHLFVHISLGIFDRPGEDFLGYF